MSKKTLRLFDSPLLAVGMLFLVNPTVSLFDILPDFIGYLMIYAAVSSLATLNEQLALASKKLLYLAVLSALRSVAWVTTLGGDSSTVMMLCFVFMICEAIIMYGFISDWFDGFGYLMQRFGAFEALSNQADTRFITSAFFFTRIVIGFVPELAAIFELRAYFDIEKSPVWEALASYKPYAVLLFSLIVLIMGVYWYFCTLKYINGMRKDPDFIKNASARYFEVWGEGRSDELFYKAADICVIAGFVFVCDVTLNMVPILPTFISTLLLFAACLLISKLKLGKGLVPWAVFAVTAQIAFEVYAKLYVDPTVRFFDELSLPETAALAAISVLYIVSSTVFMLKAQNLLCKYRLETTGLSPEKGWSRLNPVYFVFLSSHAVGYILPPVAGVTLWIRMLTGFAFIAGGIVCWNRAIKTE